MLKKAASKSHAKAGKKFIKPAKSTPKAKSNQRTLKSEKTTQSVTLLSGGNPQIPKGEGDGPVQAYIAALHGWKQEVGRRVDTIIVQIVPNVYKAVKWNSPFYGNKGDGWFVSIHVFTRYVKVTFFRGSSLDPQPAGISKDEAVRYLDIYEGGLDEAQFADWIRQASRLPGEKL